MKKVNKGLLVFALLIVAVLTFGCEKKTTPEKESTVATKLVETFKAEIAKEKDIEKVATKISEDSTIEIAVMVMEANEGYLNGFDGEVKGFTKAYSIGPMVGAQPFVAYVFETKDAESLAKTLKEQANKRWNVCTEADDLEIATVDNYVFLVMAPSSFEE